VKVYYDWLCHSGQRRGHPPQSIRLRDNRHKDVQLQDLFKPEELEGLLERKNRYTDLLTRNQVMISLLIDQGLLLGEMKGLRVADIQLKEGTIYVKAPGRIEGPAPKAPADHEWYRQSQIEELKAVVQKYHPFG